MLGWIVLTAAAQAGQAPPAAPAPRTNQQLFDAANRAAIEQRCSDALGQYAVLEQVPAISRNPLARATIDVYKGGCLIGTDRTDEGEALVRRGLPVLAAKSDFAAEVRDGWLSLASAARRRSDYDTAVAETEKAVAVSQGLLRIRPLQILATLTMFDGDGRAIRLADEARTLINADPNSSAQQRAAVQTTYGRALLNAGRIQEADAALRDSLAKQGGLDNSVSIADVATRSDLAIAALLTGDHTAARKFLAYTGAGRISDAPFQTAAAMEAPTCDPAIGLDPEDRAIVEFSLREDGQVGGVQPIYVTGGRKVALAFGAAVSRWSWTPEQAKAVPPFYRALTRVELRCSRSGETPSIDTSMREAAQAWLTPGSPPVWDGLSAAAALPVQRAAFGRSGDPRARLAAGMALIASPVFDGEQRAAILPSLAALADETGAPASIRVQIALNRLNTRYAKERGDLIRAMEALNTTESIRRISNPDEARDRTEKLRRAYNAITRLDERAAPETREGIRALLAEPGFSGDPLVASTLRLMLATPDKRGPAPDAAALLDAVIATNALPPRDPLRVHAMLRRADLFAAAGDTAAAAAMVAQTGLSTKQRASLGVTPVLRTAGASSSSFPQAAQRWGFEGWVRTEFDITADGRAAAPRALTAYPPFVFDEAATDIAGSSRWTSSFRGQPVACTASNQQVRFVLPK